MDDGLDSVAVHLRNLVEPVRIGSDGTVGSSSPFLGGRRRAARKQAAALADDLTADVADCAREAHYGGFAACPLLTEREKAILATYDYESATAPAYSTRLGWMADVHFIPRLYWSVWLRGYQLGT